MSEEIKKCELHPVRLDSDVWAAVKAMPVSLNVFLRETLLGVPASSSEIARIAAQVKPRKQSKKEQHVAALKASDPIATILERDDIEHGNMELPSSGSVAMLDATASPAEGFVRVER